MDGTGPAAGAQVPRTCSSNNGHWHLLSASCRHRDITTVMEDVSGKRGRVEKKERSKCDKKNKRFSGCLTASTSGTTVSGDCCYSMGE